MDKLCKAHDDCYESYSCNAFNRTLCPTCKACDRVLCVQTALLFTVTTFGCGKEGAVGNNTSALKCRVVVTAILTEMCRNGFRN